MFHIKICGITTPEDALLAAQAGADAIGLNFYEKSPRYVTPSIAKDTVSAVRSRFSPADLRIVGVFVNPTADFLEFTMSAVELRGPRLGSGVQLHGDEPPGFLDQIARDFVPVDINVFTSPFDQEYLDRRRMMLIKAIRCKTPDLREVKDFVDQLGPHAEIHGILVDANRPGVYGGTGHVVDWNMIRDERDKLLGLPLILAGGLTPENVAEAIATARPDAVDVASGVESSPGRKDPAKVRAFVAAAKEAFAKLA